MAPLAVVLKKFMMELSQEEKIKGSGITAQLLIKNGIKVISENNIEEFLNNNRSIYKKVDN